MKYLLTIPLLLASFSVGATEVVRYQAVGVVTYEQQNAAAEFEPLNLKYFASQTACTNAIAAQDTLLGEVTVAPRNGQKVKQNVDGICHAVLPYSQSVGYRAIGTLNIQQNNKASQRVDLDIGPVATEQDCNDAIGAQKALAVQNTPITDQNVGYSVEAKCSLMY